MSLVEVMVVIAIILTLMSVIAIGVLAMFGDSQGRHHRDHDGKGERAHRDLPLRKKSRPPRPTASRRCSASETSRTTRGATTFVYVSPGPEGRAYDLISYGADGEEGGTGNDADIRWSEIVSRRRR